MGYKTSKKVIEIYPIKKKKKKSLLVPLNIEWFYFSPNKEFICANLVLKFLTLFQYSQYHHFH